MSSEKKKIPTLFDVAEKAGVSISTVSKILKNSTKFRKETVEAVKAAVEELNYYPDVLAQRMVAKKNSPLITYFVPNIRDPFFSEFVYYLEKYLREAGYMLTICVFNYDCNLVNNQIEFLIRNRAVGAVFAGCRIDDCLETIKTAQQYMNIISVQSDIPGITRIDVTSEAGGYDMAKYLINHGHKKIAFVGYGFDMTGMKARLDGYKRALKECGIPINESYIINGVHDYDILYQMTLGLLRTPERPTAIQCATEFIARAVYKAIYDSGLKIPEDISVGGFDNLSISTTLYPTLTTIAQPLREMAKVTAQKMVDMLENNTDDVEPETIILEHLLIERDSVKTLTDRKDE